LYSDLRRVSALQRLLNRHTVSIDHYLPSEVAEFDDVSLRVKQQILRLDITMTDSEWVDIRQAAKQLVHVQLHARTHANAHTYSRTTTVTHEVTVTSFRKQ